MVLHAKLQAVMYTVFLLKNDSTCLKITILIGQQIEYQRAVHQTGQHSHTTRPVLHTVVTPQSQVQPLSDRPLLCCLVFSDFSQGAIL